MALEDVLARIDADRECHLEMLFRLLRQPSISARDEGVRECAELVREIVEKCGIAASVLPTDGQPVVHGELRGADDAEVTVLFYGHYDVQPPEPLEEWLSPPFEPTVRDGRIYARGAGDNKGQFLAHALAVRAFVETEGLLPVNVKLILEGEEESGSPSLERFVEANRDLLEADLVYIADGGYDDSGRPVVCLGVRGMLVVELEAHGAKTDLHSGNRGNVVPNPAWQLVDLLHTMRSPDGRVLIDRFYDDVREPIDAELEYASKLPYDPDAFAASLGLTRAPVTSASEYGRRLMFQPTLNIAGFTSGYGGKGIKTIVPSRAVLKMDMRLVVDQDPDTIFERFCAHVRNHAPDVQVRYLGAMKPSRIPPELPAVQTIIDAVRAARSQEPVVLPSLGGSLPNYVWTETLGVPAVLVPYANPDENNHAPNENLEIEAFFQGIRTTAVVIDALGRRNGRA